MKTILLIRIANHLLHPIPHSQSHHHHKTATPLFFHTALSRAVLVRHLFGPELASGYVTPCQKTTYSFCPLSNLFQYLSCLAGSLSAYCMTSLKIQMNFVSAARDNIILTGVFLNNSLAWWIAYAVLIRVSQFVSHSRLVLLCWCRTAFQVRSSNIFFGHLVRAQFADCMTCLTIQRILFQFGQIIAFSLVQTCLSLNMSACQYTFMFVSFFPTKSTLPSSGSIHPLPQLKWKHTLTSQQWHWDFIAIPHWGLQFPKPFKPLLSSHSSLHIGQ